MPDFGIDPLSAIPLLLECVFEKTVIGGGTGFIVSKNGTDYLITNWHVVTGRDPVSKKPLSSTAAADPDKIRIWYHGSRLGSWTRKEESLLDTSSGDKKWIAHKQDGVDVIALPLQKYSDAKFYSLDLSLTDADLYVPPSETVSIIGFPMGVTVVGKIPIWKTGHVASDIDLNFGNRPVFLIDATTRSGMSGSPVFARRSGVYQKKDFNFKAGQITRFLGVYSGRTTLPDGTEIGLVWKPNVINEILA